MQGHDRRSRSRGRPSKRCKYGIPPYDSLKEGAMTCCGGITRPEVEKLMDEFALRRGM